MFLYSTSLYHSKLFPMENYLLFIIYIYININAFETFETLKSFILIKKFHLLIPYFLQVSPFPPFRLLSFSFLLSSLWVFSLLFLLVSCGFSIGRGLVVFQSFEYLLYLVTFWPFSSRRASTVAVAPMIATRVSSPFVAIARMSIATSSMMSVALMVDLCSMILGLFIDFCSCVLVEYLFDH